MGEGQSTSVPAGRHGVRQHLAGGGDNPSPQVVNPITAGGIAPVTIGDDAGRWAWRSSCSTGRT